MRYDDFKEGTIKLRGFTPQASGDTEQVAAAQDAFLTDFYAASEPNPLNDKARIFMGTVIKLRKFGKSISLEDIRSMTPGAGTKAMTEICRLADQHGVTLDLYAKGYDTTPTAKLVEWYGRFRFFRTDFDSDEEGVDMERKPSMKLKLSGNNLKIDI